MKLASRFDSNSPVLRSPVPLTDEQIFSVVPSIFAEDKHASRSERYTYIPTIEVLHGLQKEGFEPFMVGQTCVRNQDKREFAKHMVRLRHANQINAAEANKIVFLNSYDGTSSYQMLGGMFRFVCQNGLVCGESFNDMSFNDIRIPHKGNIIDNVIEGAFTVLDDFEEANNQRDVMKSLTLNHVAQGKLPG